MTVGLAQKPPGFEAGATPTGIEATPPASIEGVSTADPALATQPEPAPERDAAPIAAHLDRNLDRSAGPNEAALEAGIAAITRAIASASDDEIPALVDERRAMRAELAALREGRAGNVVRLDERRKGGAR